RPAVAFAHSGGKPESPQDELRTGVRRRRKPRACLGNQAGPGSRSDSIGGPCDASTSCVRCLQPLSCRRSSLARKLRRPLHRPLHLPPPPPPSPPPPPLPHRLPNRLIWISTVSS